MMQHGSSVFTRAKQGEVRVRAKDLWGPLEGGYSRETVVPQYLQQGCKPHQKLDFTQRDPYQTSDLYNSKKICLHLGPNLVVI